MGLLHRLTALKALGVPFSVQHAYLLTQVEKFGRKPNDTGYHGVRVSFSGAGGTRYRATGFRQQRPGGDYIAKQSLGTFGTAREAAMARDCATREALAHRARLAEEAGCAPSHAVTGTG